MKEWPLGVSSFLRRRILAIWASVNSPASFLMSSTNSGGET